MQYKKKLIEVALPLEAINASSVREKSIRHGHPSTLHLWWARRPLAAARAVIFSSLVDDPSSHPELFPTEEAQEAERKRLFNLIEELVQWENSNNKEILGNAKVEILKYTDGNPPALLDPFAGGGAIPLEAQRLGLEAHASDLNPIAVMINKAMIEIPPKFAGKPPVNPESRCQLINDWKGTIGLAEDVRFYGEWMKKEAFKRIGHLYPKIKDEQGVEHTVIAWIWARTVKCPNPVCGCEIPLASSFELSKKNGKEVYIHPIIENKKIRYEVKQGKNIVDPPKTARGKFKCICCDSPVDLNYIREESRAKRMNARMLAIVAESNSGRLYFSPNEEHNQAANIDKPEEYPSGALYGKARINVGVYGFEDFSELFTNRQLTALTTFGNLIAEAQKRVTEDAVTAGMPNDDTPLSEGGSGAFAYGQAVGVYLAFLVDKLADLCNSLNRWEPNAQCPRQLFARQAIPMIWDYAEGNPFSASSGSWSVLLRNLMGCFNSDTFSFIRERCGFARQFDAQSDNGMRAIMVSTDPPYYDNISYADLSDFFYIWMRYCIKDIYPKLFRTMLAPKVEELVATPFRFAGSVEKARDFFENGMLKAFKQVYMYSREDIPVTIYYAFKQNESDEDIINGAQAASTGWETMLSAIIQAGFCITGTWPMRTECVSRSISQSANALASSIVLVCRKRPIDAPICTRRDFINTLKRELKPALQKLQASNIAPVDLAQSAIGPGIGVYSRFSKVLESDGTPMSVRSALQIINQELDLYFTEQDGELDRDSRFCVDLYTQNAFNDVKFGEADVLARAKNTSVEKLSGRGALSAQKGVVRLLTREEIPEEIDKEIIWLFTQQLTRTLEKEGVVGVAKIVSNILTSEPEQAKALAYRLYTIAERNGWAADAYDYNSLVIMWPEIQAKAAELQTQISKAKQAPLFDIKNN